MIDVLFCNDNVLELSNGDGCTTLWIYLQQLNYIHFKGKNLMICDL